MWVDDDASFRTAIERRLKQAGYEVATYPSAQHLLDRLPSESEPGCILLDVRIPGLSGPELQGVPEPAWLDIADRLPHRLSRCPDHRANHQGGRFGFSDQARIIGRPSSGHRAGDRES